MDKNKRKLKILYKSIEAIWQHIYAAHTTDLKYSSRNPPINKSHTKEPTFRKMEV